MAERTVRIIEGFKGFSEEKVCFRTGASPRAVRDTSNWAFEHEGPQYVPWEVPSSIRMFQERLLMGQEAPPVMILNRADSLDIAAAAMIFERPGTLLNPRFNGFLSSVDTLSRYGNAFLAHVPVHHATVARAFERTVSGTEEPLRKGIDLLTAYVQGRLPEVPPPEPPEVTQESGPLAVFEGPPEAWPKMWADGYLAAIRTEDGTPVEIVKKSPFVATPDLNEIPDLLNARDDEASWESDGVVAGPVSGNTALTSTEIMNVLNEQG